MKLLILLSSLFAGQTAAFTASSSSSTLGTTALNLFGGNKDGEKKGPGFMAQMEVFKKAQEMAVKKKKIDEGLAAMSFEGVSLNGKVKGKFKFVPITNPMDPNPDTEAVSFEFDDEFFESADPSEIATAVEEAVEDGIQKTNTLVFEKYKDLAKDVQDALGALQPKQE